MEAYTKRAQRSELESEDAHVRKIRETFICPMVGPAGTVAIPCSAIAHGIRFRDNVRSVCFCLFDLDISSGGGDCGDF
jgi:hypothetical protein